MRVYSLFTDSLHSGFVEIEFHSRFQIPSFQVLGLPAPEIQEAKERIMAAFQASELEFPKKKVIINLAPASIKKSGTGHDLAIAIKIMSETQEILWPDECIAWGELSLNGEVKAVGKMACLIERLLAQSENDSHQVYLCDEDYQKLKELLEWRKFAKLANPKRLKIKVIQCLRDVLSDETFEAPDLKLKPESKKVQNPRELLGLSQAAERVLKISLVGKHHVLLLGPKGVGKSESLKWYQALLPESDPLQTWQRIVISENRDLPLDFNSPVRRVHAQVRPAHLLGSFRERGYMPGELALAHGGIFIADEFMEWPRDSKEALREPLQSKIVFLTRVKGQIECPSDFQMIATGNLCPCGGLPQTFRGGKKIPTQKFKCKCKLVDVENYFNKLSGPILDRIDLSFIMVDTEAPKLQADHFEKLQNEIIRARTFSKKHFGFLSAELSPSFLDQELAKDPSLEVLLSDVTSLRARHKILRVARSIQALEEDLELKKEHIFEAKWYRLQSVDTL